jgi:ABC-type multidrug transport system fused ATPase/permease subunit
MNKKLNGEPTMKKRIFLIIMLLIVLPLISYIFVTVSPLVFGTKVNSAEEMKGATFGLPIPFLTQDLTYDYEGDFPRHFGMDTDFLDSYSNTQVDKSKYILSILIVYGILVSIFFIMVRYLSDYVKAYLEEDNDYRKVENERID